MTATTVAATSRYRTAADVCPDVVTGYGSGWYHPASIGRAALPPAPADPLPGYLTWAGRVTRLRYPPLPDALPRALLPRCRSPPARGRDTFQTDTHDPCGDRRLRDAGSSPTSGKTLPEHPKTPIWQKSLSAILLPTLIENVDP